MAQHECSEKERLERFEKLLGGNSGKGLIVNFERLEIKVNMIDNKLCDLQKDVRDLSIFMHKQNSAKVTKDMVLEAVLKKRVLFWRNIKWICWFVAFLAFGIAGIFIALR